MSAVASGALRSALGAQGTPAGPAGDAIRQVDGDRHRHRGLACRRASRGWKRVGKGVAGAQAVSAARTHGRPGAGVLHILRVEQAVEDWRGCDRDAGGCSRAAGRRSRRNEKSRTASDLLAVRAVSRGPRSWAGPNLLATILFEKFGQHHPLHRQRERYVREASISASRPWPTR